MSTLAPSASSRRTVALALSVILALIVVVGGLGGICIDRGRSVAAAVGAAADQAMRLRAAQLATETARRLAASGRTGEAGQSLDHAVAVIGAAADNESYLPRKDRIRAVARLADAFRASLATGDAATLDATGGSLADALADLDRRQGQDLLETEINAPVVVLQTLSLYGTLLIVAFGVSVALAIVAVRSRPAG
ncbi:MAG: hypothetical protein M0006_08900 [Magnetospirillum sp.]|nr:hypothetical protein [Magnetospirillum sp.]